MEGMIQGLGFVGLCFGVLSLSFKRHRQIVLTKLVSELCFALQYLLLGAYAGAAMNAVSVTRNYVFYKLVQKNIPTGRAILFFSVCVVAAGIYTYGGPASLMPVAAKLLTTVSYGMKNERLLRAITAPSCIIWIIYNVFAGSWAGVLTDALALLALLFAMYRYDLKKGDVVNEQYMGKGE